MLTTYDSLRLLDVKPTPGARIMSSSDWNMLESMERLFPTAEEAGWERLTTAQKQLIAMMVIEGQVGNGGFHAVYYNNCAHYLPIAVSGYEAIGAEAHADICRRVLRIMNDDPWAGPPETWPDRAAVEPPPDSGDIGEFDEPWWKLEGAELLRLKVDFIARHPLDFPQPRRDLT